ncbi:MAG TPA: 2,3-bisphosphoglycerate-dependent phosphoglycerate mutase [Pseudonocardiaceae bacterium]|jgi:2,3-bisphosphoglycerate-dependent phosphoglycerate mutase|nr:2,3-bisphosphoglycerate-dependent phosphoglycerate mutase [Pseudonocardiaceae bacterium]
MTGRLILLRHGASEWTEQQRFTGWIDVPLSERGARQARRAGELLAESKLLPDTVHTSLLGRAIQTANLALDECGRLWIEVSRSWRLNERHYGALQGKRKSDVLTEFGGDQFLHWRRSLHGTPPPLPDDSPYSTVADPRYSGLADPLPRTESLAQVRDRLLPYWHEQVFPELAVGRTVLVASHSNTLRALIKHLESIGDEDIVRLNVPTGIPLVYEFDDRMAMVGSGRYLDPRAASAGAAEVADEGRAGQGVTDDQRRIGRG